MSAEDKWSELEHWAREIRDLDAVIGLLGWDEQTCAPLRAAEDRGRQTATMEAVRHRRLTDPRFADLLGELGEDRDAPHARRRIVERLLRRQRRAARMPESLVRAMAEARSRSLVTWEEARADARFSAFAPALQQLLSLCQEAASAVRETGTLYEALLDEFEPGMTSQRLSSVFGVLRPRLTELVEAIGERNVRTRPGFVERGPFPDAAQWAFTMRLLSELGFDMDRGRQDRSTHPFTETCGPNDVRVTTRISETDLLDSIYSTIHEAGHGLYEQGFDPQHHGTPLAEAPSLGIHESQSRLWENMIGRSQAFWTHYLPVLRSYFPGRLDDVSVEKMVHWVNHVEPGFIRVDADEVTYNLHIILRYELESALIAGDLSVADLPSAWTDKMREYLGIEPPNDAKGVLQDIHWAVGAFGYFPTYAIGNLYAAQLLRAIEASATDLWTAVAKGDHAPLLSWLRVHVHQKGHLESAEDTIRGATGQGLEAEPFLGYLREKYATLYGL